MGEQRTKKVSEEEMLKQAEEQLKMLKKTKEKKVEPGEDSKKLPFDSAQGKKVGKQKIRSKKYQEVAKLVDKNKKYNLDEALELARKTNYAKFDASIELHLKLKPNKKGEIESLRGLIRLPHSTGKKPKVAILDEDLITKITKEKKTEFDILLATPALMPKIAKIAKILGPQGKMPNPKSGTVTNDPQKVFDEIKTGRIEYKTDSLGNIHWILGKISFNNNQLKENYQAILTVIPTTKLQSATICGTMGPGIKIQI